jgi:hypothetical protein
MRKTIVSIKEPHYNLIDKYILCEELIQDKKNILSLNDYKFQCINGKIHHILVCTDRDKNLRLHTYDLNWNRILNFLYKEYNDDIPKPINLEKMIEVAKALSVDFPYVRVDLYDTSENVYFSELTFTPYSGRMPYYTMKALRSMWNEKLKK